MDNQEHDKLLQLLENSIRVVFSIDTPLDIFKPLTISDENIEKVPPATNVENTPQYQNSPHY